MNWLKNKPLDNSLGEQDSDDTPMNKLPTNLADCRNKNLTLPSKSVAFLLANIKPPSFSLFLSLPPSLPPFLSLPLSPSFPLQTRTTNPGIMVVVGEYTHGCRQRVYTLIPSVLVIISQSIKSNWSWWIESDTSLWFIDSWELEY